MPDYRGFFGEAKFSLEPCMPIGAEATTYSVIGVYDILSLSPFSEMVITFSHKDLHYHL